jgi:hypothetical protein
MIERCGARKLADTFAAKMDWGPNSNIRLTTMSPSLVQLDDNEIKMLLVAIRQVQHTFAIAEQQSTAAGEPLAGEYESIREAYERLHHKLSALAGGAGTGRPHIVK